MMFGSGPCLIPITQDELDDELCRSGEPTRRLLAKFAFEACHTAMLTLGGMGYAQEYHVERYLRETLIPRTAPVSPHMILNFLAEKFLELPKSY